MNNNLPFYKKKLSFAILMSVLVGAVPFSARAQQPDPDDNICSEDQNIIAINTSGDVEAYCTLKTGNHLTITDGGTLTQVKVAGPPRGDQQVINEGEILDGISVTGDGTSVVIDNSGIISSVGKSYAISIAPSTYSARIVNRVTGTINGGVFLSKGTLEVQGGRIIGDVDGYSGSKVNFTGDFATEGSFSADASISIDSGVTLTLADESGTVTNAGTLYVSRLNDERYDGAPFKVTTILGDYRQEDSASLKIDLASTKSYSQLVIDGDASFDSNAKIDVNVIGTPELSIDSTIDDIVSAKSITSDGFLVSDNSALFDFTAQLNGNTIDLLIQIGESIDGGKVSVLGSVQKNANSPAAGVAKLMDKLIVESKSTPGLQRLITALGELKTEAEVSAAVSQLLPLLTGNQSTALSGGVGAISQVVQSRAEGSQGMSSGDAMPGEKQGQIFDDSYMWLKGFGSMADQGTVGGITGFDADSSGLVIGLDGAPTDKDRIGLAFAYARTDVDSKDNLNSVDINTYQLVGYGSHSLTDDTQFSYQASYGVHQSEGSRNISIVSTIATSDFDSTSMGAGFGLLHSFKISDQLTITPSLRNDYTYMDNDGYTETGAGSLNLIVDSNDSEQWLFDLSSKAVYRLTESINLTGSLGASYDVINEQSTSLSALAGSPGNVFTTQGLKSDPWLYSAGIGLVMETDSGTKITAHYDYSTRDDFDNQSISLKARWMF
jgi:uncharacterized protein with beta-barrel porin domain